MQPTLPIFPFLALLWVPAQAQELPERVASPQTGAQGNINTVQDAIRALAANTPSSRPGEAAPAMPATNPGTWVTTSDYPAWAVNHDITGRVRFIVDVAEDGRVSSCRVTEGTGVPDLDNIVCEKITERARFVPARNQHGEPVPGSWASTVVWDIADGASEPAPQPGYLSVSMIVERDGSVSDCQIERAEGEVGMSGGICDEVGQFTPLLDEEGNAERRRIRIMMRVAHEPVPD